jgi:hypothetical protein
MQNNMGGIIKSPHNTIKFICLAILPILSQSGTNTMNATDDTDEKTLAGFENFLFDGKEQWVAHPQYDDENEVESYVVFFMDVEYDPIAVKIDLDGNITMPDEDDYQYLIMNPEMLRRLADIAEECIDWDDEDEDEDM